MAKKREPNIAAINRMLKNARNNIHFNMLAGPSCMIGSTYGSDSSNFTFAKKDLGITAVPFRQIYLYGSTHFAGVSLSNARECAIATKRTLVDHYPQLKGRLR